VLALYYPIFMILMTKITVIIPCKDEEHNIREVLESVKWADEIMVVDSFSSDNTLDIAKEYTNCILQHEYKSSAAQKNWAIPQAKHDWILLVDADERVTPELKNEIIERLSGPIAHAGYWMYRDNYFMGKRIRHGGMGGDKVVRLFKRDLCRYEERQVHAEIIADGELGFLKNKLIHNTYKDLSHYLQKVHRYSLWSAMDFDKKTGSITFYHVLVKPGFKFFQFYILKRGFLDGFAGFVVAALASYSVLLRFLQLWSIRNNTNQ